MTVAEAFRRNLPGPLLIAGRLTFAPVRASAFAGYCCRDWRTGVAFYFAGQREARPATLALPL